MIPDRQVAQPWRWASGGPEARNSVFFTQTGTKSDDRTSLSFKASVGQTTVQAPHPRHFSGSTTVTSSAMERAPKKHRSTHVSHPQQSSESTKAPKRLGA